ncbi:MAG: phage antirepressor protein, partial [Candidatus Omnitrophica bacterium]|nr:phage antirepressor protein [Candidatus Omnitrophota bacterium]
MADKNKIVVFQDQKIRRIWYQDKWYFVIVDIVSVLTNSTQPSGYIKDMRRRDRELSKGWGQIA